MTRTATSFALGFALLCAVACGGGSLDTGSIDQSVPDLALADLVLADLALADLALADLAGDAASRPDGASKCSPDCSVGFACCGGVCVNTANDIKNCGQCGNVCGGTHPYCDGTKCTVAPPCDGQACFTGFCCGATCCGNGELCCQVNSGGPTSGPKCYDPLMSGGTCPGGCPTCL